MSVTAEYVLRGHDVVDEHDTPEDETYELNRRDVAAILYAVDVGDRERLVALMEPLHADALKRCLRQAKCKPDVSTPSKAGKSQFL